MAVQVAAEVAELDQLRQPAAARRRRLELAAALAQLGRDPVEPERRVDLLLGRAAQRLAGRVVEDPVLGDVQPAPHRRLAQRHVVRLGAGEVLEHVAELVGLDDLEVDLQARRAWSRARRRRRSSRPTRRSAARASAADERRRVGGGGDDVEVLDRVGQPPQRAGDLDAVGRRVRAQRARRSGRRSSSARESTHARRGAAVLVGLGQHAAQVLLGLEAEPAQAADAAVLDRGAQRVERVDAELVVAAACARLGPKPGRCMTEISPTGNFARSFTSVGMSPVSSSASSFSSSVLPIPGSSVTRPSRASCGDGHGGVAHRAGGVAVGDHAVLDRAVELVEVRRAPRRRRRSGRW